MDTIAIAAVQNHMFQNGLMNNPCELYSDPQAVLFGKAVDLKTEVADLLSQKVIENLLAEKLGNPEVWALDDREVKILDLLQEACDLLEGIEVLKTPNDCEVINIKLKGIRYVD